MMNELEFAETNKPQAAISKVAMQNKSHTNEDFLLSGAISSSEVTLF